MKDIEGKDSDNEFGIQKNDNYLQKVIRMDLILSLLSDESKIERLKIKDLYEAEIKFCQSIDYGLFNNTSEIKNAIIYNKNNNKVYSY